MAIKVNNKIKTLMLGFFIFLALLLLVLNNFKKQETKKDEVVSGINIPTPIILTAGSFAFRQSPSTEVSTGNTKEVEILANSQGKSIVAYDVLLGYDKTAAEILAVESLIPEIDVYPVGKDDYFVITGAKKLEANDPLIFEDTPIIKLKIIVKKPAGLTLSVLQNLGKEKSQLVDDKSVVLNPEVGEFKLEI